MLKILTCNCERARLDRLNVNYTYASAFDECPCDVEHKVFSTKCKTCRYNVVGFARHHFAYVVCSCCQTDKDLICNHCKQLLHAMNFSTIKVCVEEKDLPKEVVLMKIDKYLEMRLRADPVFFYSKEKNRIHVSIDAIYWGEFFHHKKTI